MPKNTEKKECCMPKNRNNNAGGVLYGMGFVGALVYFLSHALNAGEVLLGVLKAIAWPAILVFKAFELLKM